MKPPSFLIVGEFPCLVRLVHLSCLCDCFSLSLLVTMIDGSLVPLFAVSHCPRLKKRYHHHVEKVKEYLESVKDFDELISPQTLSLHFLGPKSSTKVRKKFGNCEKECVFLPSSFFFFSFFFFNICFVLSRMTTRFSKQKLAEAQEKKAKGGTVSGLLSKKKTGDVSKKDSVTTILPTHSPTKRLVSPTLSLEMIAFSGEEIKKKKKASGKSFLPTF